MSDINKDANSRITSLLFSFTMVSKSFHNINNHIESRIKQEKKKAQSTSVNQSVSVKN